MNRHTLLSNSACLQNRKIILVLIAVVTLSAAWPLSAEAQRSPVEQRGFAFAKANCAHCHSIDKVSLSPLAIAPPFRYLHHQYPVENLEEALAEGIVTGHPTMPEFQLEADQAQDLIAFLKSLER